MIEQSDFQILKEDLVSMTSSFCRKITSYSLLEDIKELQGIGFYPHELYQTDFPELIKICEQILEKVNEYKHDLQDYGINEKSIHSFREMTDQFKIAVEKRMKSEKSVEILDAMLEKH